MPVWPDTLPQRPTRPAFTESRERAIAEFKPDVGRPIRRRRQTLVPELLTATYWMTDDQLTAFWAFWTDDIGAGLSTFYMPHPKTGTLVSVELLSAEPPSPQPVSYDVNAVTLGLRVLP